MRCPEVILPRLGMAGEEGDWCRLCFLADMLSLFSWSHMMVACRQKGLIKNSMEETLSSYLLQICTNSWGHNSFTFWDKYEGGSGGGPPPVLGYWLAYFILAVIFIRFHLSLIALLGLEWPNFAWNFSSFMLQAAS